MATSLYITPTDLTQGLLPTGIQWSSFGGPSPTPDLTAVAILETCKAATREVNGECGQSLQTAVRTEAVMAPGHRCGLLPDGTARFLASFSPIMAVLLAQVAYSRPSGTPAVFQYTNVPAGLAYPEYTAPSDNWQSAAPGTAAPGQNAILISPCYVNWCNGRMGERVQVSYYNAWPNSQITADVAAGDLTVTVDDVTGWAGVGAEIYDGVNTESVFVESVSATHTNAVTGTMVGPGTLTLQAPTASPHAPTVFAPVLISATPHPVRLAASLFAKAEALQRGATVVTGPAGKTSSQGGSASAAEDALHEAALKLASYRRTSF